MRISNIFIAAALLLLASCKNYLDIKPYGKTIPKTAEEFAALLHARLNEIDYASDDVMIGNSGTVLNTECFTDNLDASLTIYPAGNSLPLYAGSQINSQQSRYERFYQRIRDCNIIINNFDSEVSRDDKNVLGTAYAMRGIAYYNLLREYCEPYTSPGQPGLPLVSDFDMEGRPLRSTYQQTVAFIEGDLKKALTYAVKADIFRYTDHVAKAYLARLYFWTKDWDKAIIYADELLKDFPLPEGAAYTNMIQATNEMKGNMLLRSFRLTDQSSTLSYTSAMQIVKARPVAKEFADLFTEGDRDIRKGLFFTRIRESTKNLMACVRTDEMCLMLAEAYAHKGDNDQALLYLNLLRSKRISGDAGYTVNTLPPVNSSDLIKTDAEGKGLTPLMQAVLNERRKEFFAEGDRWFELKRNGCPEFWVASDGRKFVTEKYLYTYPLPRVDVELISGLVQNPGYSY
ncbi:MAG: RagB/SusD family nutrient uptake outer membrane protein [Candidatus Pseudobacter hemicellulosilyticus]|uniref:RagB/SusD family nutrient uptake outer membrane protein n=1 Tax=Candidatus Pseudobacter hemicellulosilyticus TaxID=3121375 RepID=A0AAJ5WR71_9BACT|nr:MAG: RagB/SusD family nutrient uptake outer membrane protein [Pseudobacter sp.]